MLKNNWQSAANLSFYSTSDSKKDKLQDVAAVVFKSKVIGAVRLGLVDIRVVIEELDTEAEMQRIPEIAKQLHEVLIYNNSRSPNFAVEKVKPRSMKAVGKSIQS